MAMTGIRYPVRVVSLHRRGKVDEAARFSCRCVPLMRFGFQAGMGIPIWKELLKLRGVLE